MRGISGQLLCVLALSAMSAVGVPPTNPYHAPLGWSPYEYHIMRERISMPSDQNYLPESEFRAHADLVETKLKPLGYDMLCIDGWGDTTKLNGNGYRTTHSRHWTNNFADWSTYLRSRGMRLGMYINPLWLHVDASNTTEKIVGTTNNVSSLYDAADPWWVQIDRPGAEAYVKGYVKYFADMGIDYLRVDFLSWYESGWDRYLGSPVPMTRPGGHPSEYATALRWMREAADQYGVFLSLVMPNLNNEAAAELEYGHMIRINEDTLGGGWDRWNDLDRGVKRTGWSVYANSMDGLTYWSYLAGREKMILDPDFIRLNTFVNDEQRKSVISACLLSGAPIIMADMVPTLGRHLWLYTNPEMLALNQDGFVGKPLTNDLTSVDSQIWAGQMSNGDWIVGLFNRENTGQTRSLDFSRLGLGSARVRDFWQHADLGTYSTFTVSIPAYGCRVLKLVPGASSLPGLGALRVASLQTDTVPGSSGGLHGRATFLVTDGFGNPISGANLTAAFSGSYTESVTGTSDSSGWVRLVTTAVATETPTANVEITDLQKTGYVYGADLNGTTATSSGNRMYLGGTFSDWRLQDFPMQWVNGIWQADRIAWKTNSYQLKFADQLYFTTQSWGGATGTNGTAIVSAAGNNINFTLTQAGLYNVRFNPTNLAYSITLDWAERDVGTVSAVGSSLSLGDNSFLLRSSGADIEGTADEFHYLYQTRSGDLLMQTKITSLTPTHGWAKAGLMIRQNNTNANTRYAAVLLTASNGVSFQSRSSTGGTNTISITGGIGAPVWLRLKKSSTSFQSFYSTDGKSWSEIGSSRTVGSTANWSTFTAGLAGTSHLDGVLTEASFDELSIRTNTASSLIITPNPPVRGRNVTLAYYADGRSLAGSDDVSLIASHSGSYDLLTPAPQMTGISPDVWSYTYPVPYNATSISLSFSNSAGLIDTGGTFSTAAPTTSAQSAPTNTPTRPQGPNLQPYAVGSGFKFIWDAVPSQNGIAPIYRVTTTKNGQTSTAITGLNEFTVQGTAGDLFSISVQAVYPYDFSQSGPASLTSLSTTLLLPDTDQDGDGLSNTAEQVAGTDPFDSQSNFEVSSITRVGASQISVEWKSVPGKKYQVQWCSSLSDGFTNPANATLVLSASAGSTTTWTDLSASGSARFYRVIVVP